MKAVLIGLMHFFAVGLLTSVFYLIDKAIDKHRHKDSDK